MKANISQPAAAPADIEIREILKRRIDQQKQALGIVVGIIEPNGRRVVAYGNLGADDPRVLDGDTIFEIGSVSKVFTSLLLADMVNRKEAGLDDPAARYVPEHVRVPGRRGKSITLLDLATHRSGLPNFPGNMRLNLTEGQMIDAANPHALYSRDDLYQFLSGYTLLRDPGSEFEYSNMGAGLLGHLLANGAGIDYEALTATRIMRPLDLRDTVITLSPSARQRMASGHRATLAPVPPKDWEPSHGLTGAGAWRSSANDMLTFLAAFLGYTETPLAPAMKAMLEVRRPAGKSEISLGWFISSAEGSEIVWHNGATPGFRSFVGYDPRERMGAVVLANAFTQTGVDDIGFHLLNPNLRFANPEPPKQRTGIQIDPNLLDNYTGRYQMTPNLTFEIIRDGDRLFAQGFAQIANQAVVLPMFELFAETETRFFARVADNQFTFQTGTDGRAGSIVLHRGGRDISGRRLS